MSTQPVAKQSTEKRIEFRFAKPDSTSPASRPCQVTPDDTTAPFLRLVKPNISHDDVKPVPSKACSDRIKVQPRVTPSMVPLTKERLLQHQSAMPKRIHRSGVAIVAPGTYSSDTDYDLPSPEPVAVDQSGTFDTKTAPATTTQLLVQDPAQDGMSTKDVATKLDALQAEFEKYTSGMADVFHQVRKSLSDIAQTEVKVNKASEDALRALAMVQRAELDKLMGKDPRNSAHDDAMQPAKVFTDEQHLLVDHLLYAMADLDEGINSKADDVLAQMIFNKHYTSRTPIKFRQIVELAIDMDMVNFNKNLDELSFQR